MTEGLDMSKTAGLLLGFFFFVITLSDAMLAFIIQVFVGIGFCTRTSLDACHEGG